MVDHWITELLANDRSWALEVRSGSELPHAGSQNISVVRIGRRSLFVARLYDLAISVGYVLGDSYQSRSDSNYLATTQMASRRPLDSERVADEKGTVACTYPATEIFNGCLVPVFVDKKFKKVPGTRLDGGGGVYYIYGKGDLICLVFHVRNSLTPAK